MTRKTHYSGDAKTPNLGVAKTAVQKRSLKHPMKETIAEKQRKISRGAALIGRIGGSKKTKAQTDARRRVMAEINEKRREKFALQTA